MVTGPTAPGAAPPARCWAADLGDGERYDATRERPGWSRPGFDDTGWDACRIGDLDVAALVAPDGPPVRATGALACARRSARHRERPCSTSASTSSAGSGSGSAAAGARRSPSATRRRSRTASSPCARRAPPWPPTATRCAATAPGHRGAARSGSRSSPCTASATPRYPASTATSRGGRRLPCRPAARRLVRLLGRPAHPAARQRRVEHARQLRRRAGGLPAAGRTEVFAPAAYLYDCAGFLASWLKDPARPAGATPR